MKPILDSTLCVLFYVFINVIFTCGEAVRSWNCKRVVLGEGEQFALSSLSTKLRLREFHMAGGILCFFPILSKHTSSVSLQLNKFTLGLRLVSPFLIIYSGLINSHWAGMQLPLLSFYRLNYPPTQVLLMPQVIE